MPTFVLMTRLSTQVTAQRKDREALGRAWLDLVKEKCPGVKFLAHYALLGQYDFLDIYEAPNIETAAKVSMISRATGAVTAESWAAIPYKHVLELATEISDG